ncbi:hypothetical protein D3C78_1575770 [compost metagenome]
MATVFAAETRAEIGPTPAVMLGWLMAITSPTCTPLTVKVCSATVAAPTDVGVRVGVRMLRLRVATPAKSAIVSSSRYLRMNMNR